MRRLYVLLGLLVLVPFFSLATGSIFFYRLLYSLGALVIVSTLWSFTNIYRLRATVSRPHGPLQVGDILESLVVLENRSFLPKMMLEVSDFTAIPGHSTSRVVNLGPYRSLRWEPQIVLQKRGVFPLGHLTITSTDAFGIVSRQKIFRATEEVVVYPAVTELPWFYIPEKGLLRGSRATRPTQAVTPQASSVRDYMHGDPLRHIHWPSTARKGQFMVKQFYSGMENTAWLLLDLERGVQAGEGIETTEEYIISAAASVIHKFVQVGWKVGMAAQGDHWYFLPSEEQTSQQKLLETLARAQAQGSIPLASLLAESHRYLPAPPLVLVVITPSTDNKWVAGASTLQHKGAMVSVVLVNASSFGGRGDLRQISTQLWEQGIPAYMLRRGDNLTSALDYRSAISQDKEVV